MKAQEVREVAEMALGKIKATPKGQVRASIAGLVAGARFDTGTVIFRRERDRVCMEFWPMDRTTNRTIQKFVLPPDIEREAGVVLDAL